MENDLCEVPDWEFLEKYIPKMELAALKEHAMGEEKEHFIKILANVKDQITSMPEIYACDNSIPSEIAIGMHYFGGATDFWLYELDQKTREAFGFVCLAGDEYNAEIGYVDISEILGIPFLELDPYWNSKTTLAEVWKKVKGCDL